MTLLKKNNIFLYNLHIDLILKKQPYIFLGKLEKIIEYLYVLKIITLDCSIEREKFDF